MLLGPVSPTGGRPPVKDQMHDVPRQSRNQNPRMDRAALIGDARNDENLIVAQLHVAFLRAHNSIASRGLTMDETRTILRRHYQWIVIKDFLPRICDPWIVNSIVIGGNRGFRKDPDVLFMPFEFSVAGYRFGHSMVRSSYHYNASFPRAGLKDLFTL